MTIQFDKLGADPEFLIVDKGFARIAPAGARGGTTAAFVGCDGHASTGEMRPPPSPNALVVLRHLAHGLVETCRGVDRENLLVAARPRLLGEPLGGHIHVSFGITDPDLKACAEQGRMFENGQYWDFRPTRARANQEMAIRLAERELNGQLPSQTVVAKCLNYVLKPLEAWIQPWESRFQRNRNYGTGEVVRFEHLGTKRENPYVKYEYRMPSTWLQSPQLAFSYLGLAKLIMVNFNTLTSGENRPSIALTSLKYDMSNREATEGMVDYFGDVLKRRIAAILGGKFGKAVITRDIEALVDVVGDLKTRLRGWASKESTPIDREAWEAIL